METKGLEAGCEALISSSLDRRTRIYRWGDPAQAGECSSNGIQMSDFLQEMNTRAEDIKCISQTFREKQNCQSHSPLPCLMWDSKKYK